MAEDIGVNIASNIVSKIIEKLGSAAFKKIKSVKDLNSHIEKFRKIKLIIEAELHKFDPFEANTDLEGNKIKRIQRVHDELVHLFEEQETRAKQKEVMGGKARLLFSSLNQIVLPFRVEKKVNAITKELKSIASDYAQYSSIVSHSSGNQNWCTLSQETSPFPDTSVLIGRDRDKENIVNMICNSSNDHVVAIVGVGGQGKTTLAQYVCQDDRVKGSFDKLLWVSLTPKSSIIEIYEKIISSATDEKPIYYGFEHLQWQVLQAIVGKKRLLILDNVSYADNLRDDSEALNAILNQGGFWGNGGKILITTRSNAVAKLMDTSKPYELRDLAEDDTWILLRHYAIKPGQVDKKESGVEEIGKEIAKMCPRVPLVLKTIGRHLADKDYKSHWERFKKELAANPNMYMSKQQEKIKQILKLCYDQLDYNLKRCAAFCSIFPKGHLYNKNYMVHNWIALGLVESRCGMSLEDVGDAYVLELTQRAFFEEAGSFEVFKMHDVMHDLMLLIGKDKHQVIDSKTENIAEGVRYVSLPIQDLNWEVLLSSSKAKVEAILLVSSTRDNGVHGMPLGSRIGELISAFPELKVLEIYKQGIEKLPSSIGMLTLVRHLRLSNNPLQKLPKEITEMVNLSTLDMSWCGNLQELPTKMGKLVNLVSLNLGYCRKLEELPRDMGKLVKLRHVWVVGCDLLTCMPEGFGNLRELETLDMFVVGESRRRRSKGKGGAKLEELGHLKNLKGELTIKVAGHSKYIVSEVGNAHLEMKAKLWRLKIVFEKKAEEDEMFLEGIQLCGENWKCIYVRNYGGKELPAWMRDDGFYKRFPQLYFFHLGRNNVRYGHRVSRGDCNNEIRFDFQGNEDDLVKWVPRCSRIKEYLKLGTIVLSFFTRRRDGLTLTDIREDVILEDVQMTIKEELAPRSGSSGGGGQRQPDILLKSCFPNLTRLFLEDIPELEVLPEEFRDLSSLKSLDIKRCRKLKAIPDWIDTLSSIRMLLIEGCSEVKVLPDSIASLTSLDTLFLKDCRGLELLPHQISNLPKFCDLVIDGCSKTLYEKYTKSKGEYWPHLQHLGRVLITSSEGDRFEHCFNDRFNHRSNQFAEISGNTSTALVPQSSNEVATPLTFSQLLRNALFQFFIVVVAVLFAIYYA